MQGAGYESEKERREREERAAKHCSDGEVTAPERTQTVGSARTVSHVCARKHGVALIQGYGAPPLGGTVCGRLGVVSDFDVCHFIYYCIYPSC